MRGADRADEDEDPGGAGADPLSDIFFGFLAVILAMVIVLLPIGKAAPPPARAPASFSQDGREAALVLADGQGLVVEPRGPGRLEVPLDGILEDPALGERLSALDSARAVPFLVITPAGQEALFLFESRAAELGLASFTFIRLPRDPAECSHIRPDARRKYAALCDFGRDLR